LPILIIFTFSSEVIVKIVYERGEFSQNISLLTAKYLSAYAISLFSIMMREVLLRFLISIKKEKVIFKDGLLIILLNCIFSYSAFLSSDFIGVIKVTSIVSLLSLFHLSYQVRKYYDCFRSFEFFFDVFKIIVSSSLFIGLSFFIYYFELAEVGLELFLMVLVFVFLYFCSLYVLNFKVLKFFLGK
jgi:putative peptidoglycan lipid II flippase